MTNLDSLSLDPPVPGRPKRVGGLYGCAASFLAARIARARGGDVLAVAPGAREAYVLWQELAALLGPDRVFLFPDPETLPYDSFSPHRDIVSRRLELLYRLTCVRGLVAVASVTALMGRLPPPDFVIRESFSLKTGERIDIPALKRRLADAGYYAVRQVLEHGEFAVRGSLVDVFPMGGAAPFRVDFFDDEIDSVSLFDPETQKSTRKVPEIRLLPAHEFPFTAESVAAFRAAYRRELNPASLPDHRIYRAVSRGQIPSGIEYYFPLFFPGLATATLFDYLRPGAELLLMEDLGAPAEAFRREVEERAGRYLSNPDHPSLRPELLFLSPDEIRKRAAAFPCRRFFPGPADAAPKGSANAGTAPLPPLAVNRALADPLAPLREFAETFGGRIFVAADTEGRKSVLADLLRGRVEFAEFADLPAFLASGAKTGLAVCPLAAGAVLGPDLAVVTETELLGAAPLRRRRRAGRDRNFSQDAVIKNLAELAPGDPVVHEQYGIGAYLGLRVLTVDGVKTEFVALEYAEGAKMYVPVTSLYLLSRYSGPRETALTRLGTGAWKKTREKAAAKIRDVAASLLDTYARRQLKKGFACPLDREEYGAFAAGFGFEVTDDQQKAIDAVVADMTSEKTMDRLICGDVGFGKTEVAMRAAFIAAAAGRQAAILTPTTILADQHYESFRERFAGTPFLIECLSRFRSARDEKDILARIESGAADIVIGTHKLLGANVKFKNLGLLVIDEEHRFGVAQKEKIKALRAEVDVLAMTATPIPRTLNMSLNGIRDLSIIATPPAGRLAVKTFVHEYGEGVIAEAVARELKRGGQCYFLHNDVKSIGAAAERLAELFPGAKIAVAHAQMPQRELTRVMRDFYRQRAHILVCSTIIETGLDVPSANTIIIENAERFGLAQLHQLRGRVGRSHHQAYAYLLTAPPDTLPADARKRLEAISSLEELGSGFILATQDLEIRGAGEILGSEQSGQIEGIGFSLYAEMLDAAVAGLREGREPSLETMTRREVSVELHIPALFPDSYISDVGSRLQLYKRLASAADDAEVEEIQAEIVDRFGRLPPEAGNVIRVTKLKLLSQKLGVRSVEMNARYGSIEFGDKIHVSFDYLKSLVTERGKEFGLDGASRLRLAESCPDPDLRLPRIERILREMDDHYEK